MYNCAALNDNPFKARVAMTFEKKPGLLMWPQFDE